MHKKILLSIIFICTLISISFNGLAFAAKTPQVNLNGTMLSFNKAPQTLSLSQELFVEMRPLLTKLGFSISVQEASSSIIVAKVGKTFTFQLGSKTYMYNGVQYNLSTPVAKVGSYTFFTPQPIAAQLGLDTLWNPYSMTLHLKTNFPTYIQDELVSGRLLYQGKPNIPADLTGEGGLYWGDKLFYKGRFKEGKLDGFGTLYQDDKILYQGSFAKNLPDGIGTYNYPNGEIYVGGFKEGLRDGDGILRFANGLISYSGKWTQGIKSGIGQLVDEKGKRIYNGNIVDGIRSGYGIAYNDQGIMIYRGNWVNNLREGSGESFNPTTAWLEYNGNWSKDLKESTGTAYKAFKGTYYSFDSVGNVTETKENTDFLDISETNYSSGVLVLNKPLLRYIGQLDKEGLPHGQGTMGYPPIDQTTKVGVLQESQPFYEGEFYHNKLTGKGKLLDRDNNIIYDGDVVNGKRQGIGSSYVNNLLQYTGEFNNDVINGHGIGFNDKKLKIYEGNWVNGMMSGRGNAYDASGVINYMGSWSNNQKDGLGTILNHTIDPITTTDPTTHITTITYRDKILLADSVYDNGKLVKTTRDQTYTGVVNATGLPDGLGTINNLYNSIIGDYYYVGQFTNGIMTGNGKIYDYFGKILYDGAVVNGTREGNGAQYESGYIRYVGAFHDNKRNGFGALLNIYGQIEIQGNFINDVLQP